MGVERKIREGTSDVKFPSVLKLLKVSKVQMVQKTSYQEATKGGRICIPSIQLMTEKTKHRDLRLGSN